MKRPTSDGLKLLYDMLLHFQAICCFLLDYASKTDISLCYHFYFISKYDRMILFKERIDLWHIIYITTHCISKLHSLPLLSFIKCWNTMYACVCIYIYMHAYICVCLWIYILSDVNETNYFLFKKLHYYFFWMF